MYSEIYPETYFGSGIVSVPWDAIYPLVIMDNKVLSHY